MNYGDLILSMIKEKLDIKHFKELNWEGTFKEYLDIVAENPKVTRNAFQRAYDMIMSHGYTEYMEHKKTLIRYHFFDDKFGAGRDAVYGVDESLTRMVNIFKSAANKYGTERRVLLLHGPVGGAKSTIVRLLKKGLEEYSKTTEGALYTYGWKPAGSGQSTRSSDCMDCPMHEEPLHLIPFEFRENILGELNKGKKNEDFIYWWRNWRSYLSNNCYCKRITEKEMRIYHSSHRSTLLLFF